MSFDSVQIRHARASDRDSVTSLYERCYPALLRTHYPEQVLADVLPVITVAQPRLLQASGRFFVAQDRTGRILGAGGWSFERPGDGTLEPGIAHLRHFAVEPAHVRRGIGRAIAERCLQEARLAGAQTVEVYSTLNADGFYAVMGFEQIHPIDAPLTGRIVLPSIWMTMSLYPNGVSEPDAG